MLRSLGTVEDLTQHLNKVGSASDQFTAITDGEVVGTIIPRH